jgi:hypothetical protein
LARLTPAKIKAFFEGVAKAIKAAQVDQWALTKLAIIISMTAVSGSIFAYGTSQQTPFIELASVYLLYIVAYVYVIKEAAKSDKKR